MWLASRTLVLHPERGRRKGPFILVCNHLSPYDVACLIKETPRILEFVSIAEFFKHPLSRWFLRGMHAFPHDRWKPDSKTVLTIVHRLAAGRAIALFPEGAIRTPETSVLAGGKIRAGVGRVAKMAHVPILPCVILGAAGYHCFKNWLPFKRIPIGLIYGPEIILTTDEEAAPEVFEPRLRQTFLDLHAELKAAMDAKWGAGSSLQ